MKVKVDLPLELIKTLTWDRASELAAHKQFAIASDIDVYFCDQGSSWQQGSNEIANGLSTARIAEGK